MITDPLKSTVRQKAMHRHRLILAVWCLSLTLARSETDSTWVVTEACEPGLLAEDAEESTAHRRRLSGSGNTGPTNTTTNDAHSGTHAHASAQEVGFLTLCIFIGVVTRTWVEPKFFFKLIPYTVILLVVGILIGNLSIWTQLDEGTNDYNKHCHLAPFQTKLPLGCNTTLHACACNSWFDRLNVNILADLSPHVILYVFLPPLIFESAFFMDIHIFVRSFGGILALAVLGVTVATVVTGFFLQYVASEYQHSCINYKPLANFDTAMMMGAMLSATDPVAVVQLLKSLGARPSLGTLIEGESLLNDGTAYAMFLIFQTRSQWHEVATYMTDQACMKGVDLNVTSCPVGVLENVNGEAIVSTGLNLIILGPIIGYLIGRVAVSIVEFIYNDVIVETTMTVLSAYTSWCVAEYFKSSGVLAVVVTGLCMSHGRGLAFTESAKHFLHEFWEMIGYLLNTMVFIISGTIIGRKWADDSNAVSTRDLTMGMIMYLWVHVARAVALLVAQPFVNKTVCGGRCTSYDFDWRQSVVMWWGGLRGAVGLALGLIVAESPFWDQRLYTGIPEDVKSFYRDGVIFNIGFVAGMTLLVNGVTMGPLVRCLGLNKQGSEIAERNLQRVIDELDRKLRKKIHKLHQDGQKQITDKKVSRLNNKKIRQQQLSTGKNGRLVTRRGKDGNDGNDGKEGNSKKGNTGTIQEKKKTDNDHAHLNHSEFEHVNWKSVYQYMPVESATVYGRRVRKREIQSWWGTSNLFFFTRWEAEEIGWRQCVGKVLNGIVHNWCGCCFLLPARFSCLNCRGGEDGNDVAIGGNDGCCSCCCGNPALAASSTISMKDKEYNVPIRLQRRWGKYKTEFEASIVASALKNLPRGLGNGAHRHTRGGGRGDPDMHWETTGAKISSNRTLKQSSSHGDVKSQTMNNRLSKSKALKARNRGRQTTRPRRGSVLLKKGTFAEMADQSVHDAKSYLKDARASGASGASGSAGLASMEQKDLEANDEFLQCRTAEERKSMLNTLLNLGKARAQYCRFVKEKYWHVYEEGLLDKLAFRDLADAEDAMLDMTDRYFITLNHHISPILEKEQDVADAAWKTFKWEEFVISGELKSFSNTLLQLTNVPAVVIFFSQIRCCSWLVRHHLYYFVSRARDIAASYVHANEEVIRHIEHNKLFPSDIAEHIICEAEFQIMAAKDKLRKLAARVFIFVVVD
jgi:NhaP-type Na+/H+ or K+/H+ antiporter